MAKRAALPSVLIDIHGKSIDIDALMTEAHLVIITLKVRQRHEEVSYH